MNIGQTLVGNQGVALKGILCTVVESSVASVAPYTTLGTVPTAVFIALLTILIMLYSDVGFFGMQ